MERVFEVVVILGDVLRDDVGSGARGYHDRLQAPGPRFKSKHDLADIAGDDGVDVIFGRGALERAHRFRGG